MPNSSASSAEPEQLETASAAETEAIGARLAERLRPGDVVLISGELGTGKTTLVRGACNALGVTDRVSSPTFTVGQLYGGGRAPVAHLDLYRLGGLDDEEPGLLDDYLGDDTIAFIEWPEVAAGALGDVAVTVEMSHAGGDAREITISGRG